jgi:Ni2+-binding GTPase involved in maturation of urease and hydrogenase
MQRVEVERIFEDTKDFLLRGLTRNEAPIAIILGGQPASGKSQLTLSAQENHPNVKFLIVNGDLFRVHHPQYEDLIKDPLSYSEKTQIFSNVFTEKLIQEAQKNRNRQIIRYKFT